VVRAGSSRWPRRRCRSRPCVCGSPRSRSAPATADLNRLEHPVKNDGSLILFIVPSHWQQATRSLSPSRLCSPDLTALGFLSNGFSPSISLSVSLSLCRHHWTRTWMGLTGGGGLHKICGPRIYRRRQPGWVEQDRWASRGHRDQDAGSAIRRVLAASPMSSVRGSVQVPRASTLSRYADLLLFLLTWCFLEIVCRDTTLVQSCTIRAYSVHLGAL
jgi:hypothetical protein